MSKNGRKITIAGMKHLVLEARYPIEFHKYDALLLGEHLLHRHNVVLIGMKRVGISNFLRFFLYHKDVSKTYIRDSRKHVFITIGLNDLVEIDLFAFWTLTLKRILDSVEELALSPKDKKILSTIFLHSIQLKDIFLTIDGIRKTLQIIIDNGFIPTLFFIQFDRLKNVVTPEFFANLQGLSDATNRLASYVFTSYRSLDAISPSVFPKSSLTVFSHNMYVLPAQKNDVDTIFDSFVSQYKLHLPHELKEELFVLVDGYVRYLHLSLIVLREKMTIQSKQELLDLLLSDERMLLQSEELWESLTDEEKEVLKKLARKEVLTKAQKEKAEYLWNTGLVGKDNAIFSPLFLHFVEHRKPKVKDEGGAEFTKKEKLLYELLKNKNQEVCEREEIIDAVWPEVVGLGVTDWAIDRLVARVRAKLKKQKSNYVIETVKTRGYKMASRE